MAWFARYNDAKALSRGPKSIGRRALYRGAMTVYYGGLPRRSRSRTPGESQALAVAIGVALIITIVLVLWIGGGL